MRQYRCQGVKATKQYLTAYVTIEVGTTIRFAEVKIPMFMMITDEIASALAGELQRQQRERQVELDEQLPL